MDDVAVRAGVSRALVSLVMRDSPKVSDASRAKVLAAATALGYRPNLMARNLASRRTMTVGVLLDDLHNPFYAEVADGLLDAAFEHGYRLLFTAGLRRPPIQERAIETLLELHTDGVVIVSPRLGRAQLERIAAAVPLVVATAPVRTAAFDTVNNDETKGCAMVVDHLVGLGHEHIWHIDGGHGAGARARRHGYQRAMAAHGLTARGKVFPGEFTEQGGYDATSRLLATGRPPTAIFAGNDLIAAGTIDRLADGGLEVPGDVSIIGYDNTALAALRRVALTTVDQPRFAMGRLAFQCLVERIDNSRAKAVHHVLPGELIVRRSTAPPRRDAHRARAATR
jgi:DNA-binding LacI/PurR family transcriptional regulator